MSERCTSERNEGEIEIERMREMESNNQSNCICDRKIREIKRLGERDCCVRVRVREVEKERVKERKSEIESE